MKIYGWADLPDWVKFATVMFAIGVVTYSANQLADRYSSRLKGRKGFL